MSKFSYKKTAKDIGWNFENLKMTKEVPSNYNYYKDCVSHINNKTVMLDIGCGSCDKSIKYFYQAKKVIGLDNEQEMLNKAQANLNKLFGKNTLNNFEFVVGDCNNLSFDANSFDLIVSRHCGANMQQVHQILKKGGVFISEDVDNDDCFELKQIFNRGQNYQSSYDHKKETIICCAKMFSKIELLNFEEIEYYETIEDLEFLLKNTPIINGYDKEKDYKTLLSYVEKNTVGKGIKLIRRLYSFKMTK